MRTVQFQGNIPMAFSLDESVTTSLLEKATDYSKKTKKTASNFVSNLIKLALEDQSLMSKVEKE